MSGIGKVKLMDSGTALLKAGAEQEAREKVKAALLSGGGTLTEEGGLYLLDFSTWRFIQWMEARVEATGQPDVWAVSLRTGDAPRLPFDLPSRQAVSRTKAVLKALAE